MTSSSAPLFHLAEPADWEAAQATGRYERSTRGLSLEDVGFVHLATAAQWPGVRERYYADLGPEQLLLLTVDRSRLDAPLRWEVADPATGEEFPHLYGPLPVDAVTDVRPCPSS